jgi:hypothetical protein
MVATNSLDVAGTCFVDAQSDLIDDLGHVASGQRATIALRAEIVKLEQLRKLTIIVA